MCCMIWRIDQKRMKRIRHASTHKECSKAEPLHHIIDGAGIDCGTGKAAPQGQR